MALVLNPPSVPNAEVSPQIRDLQTELENAGVFLPLTLPLPTDHSPTTESSRNAAYTIGLSSSTRRVQD